MAVLLKIQTTTKQTLVAANNAFCEIMILSFNIYQMIALLQINQTIAFKDTATIKAIAWKLLLALLLADGHHVLIWIIAWICIQISYKGQSYAFIDPYVFS